MSKAKTSKTTKSVKTAESTDNITNSVKPAEQLTAIRDLLFGEQVSALEQAIQNQSNSLNQRLDNLEALIAKNSAEFSRQLSEASKAIKSDLENNRLEHVSQEGILEEKLEVLNGQFENFQQATEKDFTESHNALTKSSKELTKSINTEVDKLAKQIEKASSELSTNKADRKTLASLLESMASNLTESQA